MAEQVIESEEAKRTYRVLKDVFRSIQIEDSSIKDEEWLKKSLEVLFVTKPINKDEPFNVNRFVTLKDSVNGSDFKVSSYKFSARDTTVGGVYKIELLAFNPTTNYYYNLKATVHQIEPHLTVESCVLDSVKDINCEQPRG